MLLLNFTTFERIMAANEVSRERWSFQLAPQLTGKAQQAYAAFPPEDAKSYDAVKEAILRRYDITEETYCQRSLCRCLRKMRKNAQSNSWRCFTRPEPRVTHGTILHENRPESLMAFFYATWKGRKILPQSGLERYLGRFYAI